MSWISELSVNERRTFGAANGGWALDAMDVQIYSFVIPTLISIWGMSRGPAGVIGTATLLVSAVGGWLGGWCADRYGRVRVLQVAILWFAVFTLLSGLAQNFQQLLAARALIGWGAAAILYALLFSILPPSSAWRVLFFVGFTPALLVFFLRRLVREPDVYLRSRALAATGDKTSFLDIFRNPPCMVDIGAATLSAIQGEDRRLAGGAGSHSSGAPSVAHMA